MNLPHGVLVYYDGGPLGCGQWQLIQHAIFKRLPIIIGYQPGILPPKTLNALADLTISGTLPQITQETANYLALRLEPRDE